MSFLPLTRVNFLLLGAWRQNGIICGAYVVVAALLAGLMYRNTPATDHATVSSVFLSLIAVIQGVLALLVAPSAIRKAVLRDHQGGMIESHRLTPLSGLSLVLGYLTGPTTQAMLMFGTGVVLGTYFAASFGGTLGAAGDFLGGWYFAQIGLALLSLMVCTLVLAVALSSAGKTNLVPMLIVLGIFGGWIAVAVVPGVALLSGVMSTGAVLGGMGVPVPSGDPSVMAWGSFLHIAFATILIAASSRKVRRPHLPLFSLPLSLLLLLSAGLAIVVGWYYFGEFAWMFDMDEAGVAQWVGSTVAFVLVALFPIIAAAAERFRVDRAATLDGHRPRRVHPVDAIPPVLMVLTAILLCVILPYEVAERLEDAARSGQPEGALATAVLRYLGAPVVAVGLTLWIDYAWVYIVLAVRGKGAFWPLVLAWVVLRGVPLLAQAAVAVVNEMTNADVEPNWVLAGLSPVGTLILVTVDEARGGAGEYVPGNTIAVGLAVQALIAGAMAFWAIRIRRRLGGRGASAAVPPALSNGA